MNSYTQSAATGIQRYRAHWFLVLMRDKDSCIIGKPVAKTILFQHLSPEN
jgi:hypothetical protein